MTLVTVDVHKLIVAVLMARLTREGRVPTSQREGSESMVEGRRAPRRSRVALQTVVTEVACDMVRIRRPGEIPLMTAVTLRGQPLVLIVHVAIATTHRLVGSGQGKCRRAMTERRWKPRYGRMARSTIMVEVPEHMVRVGRLRVLCLMAGVTVCVHKIVVAVHMA